MEIVIGGIFLGFLAALAYSVLTLRERGRSYAWGRLAARAKANHEASLLREARTKELIAEWGVK